MVDFVRVKIYEISMLGYENYKKQNRLVLLFKVLSNANRFKIINFLAGCGNDGATFGQIARFLNISETNLSNHLRLMRISKVIKARQQGNFMHYSIADILAIKLISVMD